MKRKLFLCFTIISSMLVAQSNGKMKKADNLYAHLSFKYASDIYLDLLHSKKIDTIRVSGKLAMCYYKMGDMKNAEKYFFNIIKSPNCEKEWYYYYAQVLKQNGNYFQSDQWMTTFSKLSPTDGRSVSFTNNKSYLTKINALKNNVVLKNCNINTESTEFGVYTLPNEHLFYYLTNRKDIVSVYNEWSWNGQRFLNLYKARIDSTDKITDAHFFSKKTNTRYHEGPLCFSADGKRVYFTRNNISKGKNRKDKLGNQKLQLYTARVDSNGYWLDEYSLPFNSKDFSIGHPTLSNDGKTLYFSSDMPGSIGGADLFRIDIINDSTFGQPINLGKEINTEGDEMFPWLSKDNFLYFSSNGHLGLGGLDLFKVPINTNQKNQSIENLGPIFNTRWDDFALILNDDGISGFLSSNREGGKGDDDIYSFTIIPDVFVKGTLTDSSTNQVISNAIVQIYDEAGKLFGETITNSIGGYQFKIEPDRNYQVVFKAVNYMDKSYNFSSKNLKQGEVIQNGQLNLPPYFGLYCLVKDAKTGQPIENVSVAIKDGVTGVKLFDEVTGLSGDFQEKLSNAKLNDTLNYIIELKKVGYITKNVVFNCTLNKPGTINIHEKLNATLSKLELGIDLSTALGINPIYFDLGKYAIRPEAAIELDKIVKVMNEYPSMEIELGSHTDCRSSYAFNMKLSDNRAKASASYIQTKISNPNRIYGIGYGESKLKVNCPCEGKVISSCSEEDHQKNRRTEFIIKKL